MSNSELQQHKTADTVKWILTRIACILVGIMLIGIICGWFDKKAQPQEKQQDTVQTGGMVVGESSDSGISLMSATVPVSEYAAYGVSPQAESAVTLTATITPNIATNKNVDWEIAFKNPSASWATGKSATDYVAVTPATDGSQTATVECKAAFGEQMVVTAKSRENSEISATCAVDYVQKIENVSLAIGNVPVNLGGNTDVKIYIGEDNRNNGGTVALNVRMSSVYTLAERITKNVSFLNCGDGGGSEGYFTGQSTLGGPYGSSGYSCDSIDNTEGKTIYFDRRIFSSYNFCRTGTSWQGSNLVSYSDKFSEMSVSDMKYYLDILGESQKILWTVHINVTGSVGGYSYTSTGNIRLAGSEGGTDVTGLALSENILKF